MGSSVVVFVFQKIPFRIIFFRGYLLFCFLILVGVGPFDLSCVHIDNVPLECDLLTESSFERLFFDKNHKSVNLLFFRVSIGDISLIDRPELLKKLP